MDCQVWAAQGSCRTASSTRLCTDRDADPTPKDRRSVLNGTGSQQPAIDNPPQPPAPGYIFTPSVYSSARTEPCIQTHASEFQRLWKLHLSSPSLCAQYTALKTMTPMRTLSYTMRQRRTLE